MTVVWQGYGLGMDEQIERLSELLRLSLKKWDWELLTQAVELARSQGMSITDLPVGTVSEWGLFFLRRAPDRGARLASVFIDRMLTHRPDLYAPYSPSLQAAVTGLATLAAGQCSQDDLTPVAMTLATHLRVCLWPRCV